MRRHLRRHLRLIAVIVSLGLLIGAGAADFSSSASRVYVVRAGDSLWAIAQENGLSVYRLAAANNMNLNDILLIGRHLVIPSNNPPSDPVQASAPSAPAANPWTFCSTFVARPGPWGVLPYPLAWMPDRLALQPIFEHWASYYDLSLPLLEAIAWQESGWQQNVRSPAGAIGTGQLMPTTAKFIASTLVGENLNINSTSDNIRMSAAFLAYLAGVEGNSQCNTIAAYYEGPLNLSHYGVFPESQVYVASVEALIPRFE